MATERLFQIIEVDRLIPRLGLWVGRIQAALDRLRGVVRGLAHADGRAPEDYRSEEILSRRPGLRTVLEELTDSLAEIESLGGQIKDLELGLVDFPTERDGRERSSAETIQRGGSP